MGGAGIVLIDLSCKDLGARVALLVVHAQSNVILCLKYHSGCVGILVSMLSATFYFCLCIHRGLFYFDEERCAIVHRRFIIDL